MLCHTPTLASVAMEVGKGTTISLFSANNQGKSAKLRSLPVINAVDEARIAQDEKKEELEAVI
jgi:ABC-type branched-subunit amino acid transport system ATPase component